MLDSLRLWLLWQLSLTAFLVAALVILRIYAATAFFSYWLRAWVLFGIALGCAWIGLSPWAGAAKWLLIALSILSTCLQACCLYLGALSLRRGVPAPRLRERWIIGAILVAGLIFLSSFLARADSNLSISIRSAARSGALAVAYAYTAAVMYRSKRHQTLRGGRLVTWCCVAYATVEVIEVANVVVAVAAGRYWPIMQNLFLLDGACEAFLTVSMVLLLVERSRQFHERLEMYESIVPTCSVCGVVRDDARGGRGKGGWMPLEDFVRKYSEARFSHGLCPRCLETQLEYARRVRADRSA